VFVGWFYLTYNHGDGYFIFHGETEFVFVCHIYPPSHAIFKIKCSLSPVTSLWNSPVDIRPTTFVTRADEEVPFHWRSYTYKRPTLASAPLPNRYVCITTYVPSSKKTQKNNHITQNLQNTWLSSLWQKTTIIDPSSVILPMLPLPPKTQTPLLSLMHNYSQNQNSSQKSNQ